MTTSPSERAWASLADDIERIFQSLRGTAAAFMASYAARPGPYTLADLASLRPRIRETLDAFGDLAIGTGVVAAPGLLRDAPYWLEWWWRPGDGTPEPLRVNLDPDGPDFFDYFNDEWFEVPIRSGDPHVAGPYVDYACTNEYTFTLSVPVHHDTRPLGVAALDVPCDRLERRIMPALCAEPSPRALLNPDGRVIAASTAAAAPGDRLTARRDEIDPVRSGALTRLCALTGWAVTSPQCRP
ncbi:cache domain-containing protein [Actinoallomurus spadix]|uniref:Cache domain-containing protein n=1 Tax=Actinoallomurus spadix TaxID=79912 RepID=A0ABN0VT98_9ACTN|nr:cache domain-containing protein [Actinoallomurus spadix]MCO5990082.1 cache domain-containing protein [Actinoallomurus spadix]